MRWFCNKYISIFLLALLPFHFILSQTQASFEVRKPNDLIYFFEKGAKRDTLVKDNLFYLVISDSLKNNILIQTENAQIQLTENDSLIRIQYLPGMKYESWYVMQEDQWGSSKKKKLILKNFVNGTSQMDRGKVSFKISRKKEEDILIQNAFYYKD
jgi:hypothetical protein